jgi:hypothetical protein
MLLFIPFWIADNKDRLLLLHYHHHPDTIELGNLFHTANNRKLSVIQTPPALDDDSCQVAS